MWPHQLQLYRSATPITVRPHPRAELSIEAGYITWAAAASPGRIFGTGRYFLQYCKSREYCRLGPIAAIQYSVWLPSLRSSDVATVVFQISLDYSATSLKSKFLNFWNSDVLY